MEKPSEKLGFCNSGHGRTFAESHTLQRGRTWGQLGRTWGQLGRTWGQLGRTWGQLGRTWGSLGHTWGHLGASLGALGAKDRCQGGFGEASRAFLLLPPSLPPLYI